MAPKMLHGNDDGSVYVLGKGKLALYDAEGKQTKSIAMGDFLDGKYDDGKASGVTVCEKYLFVAIGYGFSLRATEDVVRFDRDFGKPKN